MGEVRGLLGRKGDMGGWAGKKRIVSCREKERKLGGRLKKWYFLRPQQIQINNILYS